jgi:hypothetical protein
MKKLNSSRPTKGKRGKIISQVIQTLDSQVARKNQSIAVANGAVSSVTGTLYTPVMPSQGVTSLTRTGDSLHIDRIQYRMFFVNGTTNDTMRVVIIQAKANNVPSLATIFDNGASGLLDITSFINFYTKNKEFIILSDFLVQVCFEGSNGCTVLTREFKASIKKINFTLGTTTAEAGQLYIAVFGTSGAGTSYSIQQRLIFHDL